MTDRRRRRSERLKDGAVFVVSFAYIIASTVFIAVLAIVYHLALLPFRAAVWAVRCRNRLVLGLLAFTCMASVATASLLFLNSPTGLAADREILVRSGMTARQIGRLLKAERVIRSERLFALAASLRGIDRKIEAGRYRFDGLSSTLVVVRDFLKRALTVNVTIPEGLTMKSTAGILRREAGLDSALFVSLACDRKVAARSGIDAPTLEGYLFPDTYNLFIGSTEEACIEKMTGKFRQVFNDRLRRRVRETGLSLHQVVTLASIIEKESKIADERPMISAVFLRRLSVGRALESCVTVEYALGYHKARLSGSDVRFESPYNTYLHTGLPPGPIASPGRASLVAALYPAADDGYLYFVARGDGSHIFSRSENDHLAAVTMLRREGKL